MGLWLRGKLILPPGEKCAAELGFPRASHTLGEKCAAELGFPRASHTPGKTCTEEPGYVRPVLVAGPPVYAWVVTGSLLFGSPPPPRRVQGCLRPTLLGQLWFDVLAVSRCACVIADWGRYLSRHNQTKSRLCRQCSFPPWDPTWIVLVVVCLSYGLVWWSIMSSGKLPIMDQAGASSTPSAPATGNVFGRRIGPGV